jgi:hypothetical protein
MRWLIAIGGEQVRAQHLSSVCSSDSGYPATFTGGHKRDAFECLLLPKQSGAELLAVFRMRVTNTRVAAFGHRYQAADAEQAALAVSVLSRTACPHLRSAAPLGTRQFLLRAMPPPWILPAGA